MRSIDWKRCQGCWIDFKGSCKGLKVKKSVKKRDIGQISDHNSVLKPSKKVTTIPKKDVLMGSIEF